MPDYSGLRIPTDNAADTGLRIPDETPAEDTSTPDEGFPWGTALKTAAVVGGLGLGYSALKGTGAGAAIDEAISPVGKWLQNLRSQSMLSGLALPKSIVGNLGTAVEQSALQRSMEPLRQLFSGQTIEDFKDAWANSPMKGFINAPGRAMSAGDTAVQSSLRRSGMTAPAAEQAVMRTALPPRIKQVFDSTVGQMAFPFPKRTFNKFIEGFNRFGSGYDPIVTPSYMAAGFGHGYATSDEKAPLSIPFGVAAAGSHGVPYAAASALGRLVASGQAPDESLISSLLPASESGLSQTLAHPLAPLTPEGMGIARALAQLSGR